MENLLSYIYEGGIYRFEELADLLDDIGMTIVRREDTGVSTTAVFAVPQDDFPIVEAKAREIGGELKRAALAGTEIAVVAPSPSARHLPHPTCDIAEYLRRAGAQTILISLARGFGQEPLIENYERRLINECDLSVFIFGDSKYCIERKSVIFENLSVPSLVTGGPKKCQLPRAHGYAGGFGRRTDRVKSKRDISNLNNLVKVADKIISSKKESIYQYLPDVHLPSLVKRIMEEVPEIMDVLSPSPITIKIDGLRVKLPYDEYAERIGNISLDGQKIGAFSTLTRSVLKGHTLIKINPSFSSKSII